MIHRYQKNGLNFVLDVNSGAVHVLDDISYAVSGLIDENMAEACPQSVVDALEQYPADEVREAYGEPTSSTSRLMSYEIAPASDDSEGASLYFRLDDSGVITAVGITAEVLIGE